MPNSNHAKLMFTYHHDGSRRRGAQKARQAGQVERDLASVERNRHWRAGSYAVRITKDHQGSIPAAGDITFSANGFYRRCWLMTVTVYFFLTSKQSYLHPTHLMIRPYFRLPSLNIDHIQMKGYSIFFSTIEQFQSQVGINTATLQWNFPFRKLLCSLSPNYLQSSMTYPSICSEKSFFISAASKIIQPYSPTAFRLCRTKTCVSYETSSSPVCPNAKRGIWFHRARELYAIIRPTQNAHLNC